MAGARAARRARGAADAGLGAPGGLGNAGGPQGAASERGGTARGARAPRWGCCAAASSPTRSPGRATHGRAHRARPQPAPGVWLACAGRRARGGRTRRAASAPVPAGLRRRRLLHARAECTRCHGRNTLPGVLLNCRGSRAEALTYGAALALWQRRLIEQADVVIVPSEFARERLRALGAPLPWERVRVLAPPLRSLVAGSRAAQWGDTEADGVIDGAQEPYALVASRLAVEKGVDVAIDACRIAGVALVVAGDGPQAGYCALRRADTRRHTHWCGSSGVSRSRSWRDCADRHGSRSCRRARQRRLEWPPPKLWPPASRWPRAASGRFLSSLIVRACRRRAMPRHWQK